MGQSHSRPTEPPSPSVQFDLVPQTIPETPQPVQQSPGTKTVVFGSDRDLGLVLGSDDALDRLWLDVDRDGDGSLGRAEIVRMLTMMGRGDVEGQVDEVMAGLDEDGSGDIDIGEFEDWYRQQPDGSVTSRYKRGENPSPARIESIGAYSAKRGLRPGMRILSLNRRDTRRMSLREVSLLLKKAGRPLTMEFDVGDRKVAGGEA